MNGCSNTSAGSLVLGLQGERKGLWQLGYWSDLALPSSVASKRPGISLAPRGSQERLCEP